MPLPAWWSEDQRLEDAAGEVVEQAYNLSEIYIAYFEAVVTKPDTLIRIHCPRCDLYWLYVLEGSVSLVSDDGRKTLMCTAASRYRVSYLPAGDYLCDLPAGCHRIFYFAYKPAALFREASPEFDVENEVFDAVRKQVDWIEATESLAMHDGSAAVIRRFLRSPGDTFLERKHALHKLALDLVFHGIESIRLSQESQQIGSEWARRIQHHIDTCIESGDPTDTQSVATHFGISVGYVRHQFKAHFNETIGRYITRRKLKLSERLLDEGLKPTQVAHFLRWSHPYFNRAFRAEFGHPPGQRSKSR